MASETNPLSKEISWKILAVVICGGIALFFIANSISASTSSNSHQVKHLLNTFKKVQPVLLFEYEEALAENHIAHFDSEFDLVPFCSESRYRGGLRPTESGKKTLVIGIDPTYGDYRPLYPEALNNNAYELDRYSQIIEVDKVVCVHSTENIGFSKICANENEENYTLIGYEHRVEVHDIGLGDVVNSFKVYPDQKCPEVTGLATGTDVQRLSDFSEVGNKLTTLY